MPRSTSKLALVLLVALAPTAAHAQILNIEKKRLERPKDGAAIGNLGVSFSYNYRSATEKDPTRVLSTGLAANVGYFAAKNAYLLISDYQMLQVNEGTVVDNGVTHLRVQIGHPKTLGWETYGQHQYDRPRGLRFRGLLGGGARLRVVYSEDHTLTLGLGPMLERERWFHPTQERDVDVLFLKASSYVSYRVALGESADLNAIAYYQVGHDPSVDVFRQRMSGEANVSARLTRRFSLTGSFQGAYETRPIVPIVRFIFTTTSGVRLDF